ncbi:MAG: thioesterase family protein [Spirochaetes bacterium]|nr:thioesterase family protein [Spirochaetota bacterium]
MSKVKLKSLDKYEYEYKRILLVKDINYGGHLGNDALVTILHEARIDLFNKLGATEFDLGDNATSIIMADLIVNYTGEGFMLDEIKIMTHIDDISSASFRLFHKIIKQDKTLALAEVGIISYNYKDKQIVEIPEVFLNKITR